MKPSFNERMRYRYENFMAKGGGAVFWSLFILFAAAFAVSIVVRWIFVLASTDNLFDHFWQHIWLTFLQIIDPGAIMEDTDAGLLMKISAIVTTFLGIVIFSMLIAFITTKFEEVIYNFRKGRSKVIEKGHTLILGWSERTLDITEELITANESEKHGSIVILSEREKEEMDETLWKTVTDPKTTRIVTRQGQISSITDLKRVNVSDAKSVIILADCSESADDEEKALSDNRVIKTLLAITALQGGTNRINIVAELFKQASRDLLETFESDKIVAVNGVEILGKALVQTSLTSGLEMVFNEILSFAGAEVYFYKAPWQGIRFNELVYHLPDGIPLGLAKNGTTVKLRPEGNPTLKENDEVLILADDDSTLSFTSPMLMILSLAIK